MTDSGIDVTRYAFRLLSYRGRSEKELRDRLLRKGFPEKAVSLTLTYLKETGLIDDRALAVDLKRQAMEHKRLGYRAARSLLRRRGVSDDIADSILAYDEDAELANARSLLDKKRVSAGNYLTPKEIKRLYDYLSRRGFSSGVIGRVLKDFEKEEGGNV